MALNFLIRKSGFCYTRFDLQDMRESCKSYQSCLKLLEKLALEA